MYRLAMVNPIYALVDSASSEGSDESSQICTYCQIHVQMKYFCILSSVNLNWEGRGRLYNGLFQAYCINPEGRIDWYAKG